MIVVREYLFLGESNISWYVYQYKKQCYMELAQLSGREIHRFCNFYEMFDKVLSEAIMRWISMNLENEWEKYKEVFHCADCKESGICISKSG